MVQDAVNRTWCGVYPHGMEIFGWDDFRSPEKEKDLERQAAVAQGLLGTSIAPFTSEFLPVKQITDN